MRAPTLFEHRERQHGVTALKDSDIIDAPELMVSERAMTDDEALAFDLLRNPNHIVGHWAEPEEVR